jgi:hypothetical protein
MTWSQDIIIKSLQIFRTIRDISRRILNSIFIYQRISPNCSFGNFPHLMSVQKSIDWYFQSEWYVTYNLVCSIQSYEYSIPMKLTFLNATLRAGKCLTPSPISMVMDGQGHNFLGNRAPRRSTVSNCFSFPLFCAAYRIFDSNLSVANEM